MVCKILTIILLSTLAAGALTGCQAKEASEGTPIPPADQVVITFAYPEYLTFFTKANYQLLADAFSADNPNLRVELREFSTQELMQTDTDYLDLIFDQELGVDVFLSRDFRSLIEDERVLDLEPLIAADPAFDLDDFYSLALNLLRQDGRLKGLPSELDLVVIYYNKDLFNQADVPYPASGWTRDDFLETAIALRKGLPERKMAFVGQLSTAMPFIYAHGGAVREEGDYTLTDPRTVEAVRWFAELALLHEVMPLPERLERYEPEPREGASVSIVSSTFGEGEVPATELRWGMIGAKAGVAAQEGDAALWAGLLSERQGTGGWNWDFGWGIVPWPGDKVEVIFSYTFAYFVSANTPHREAALRWIDFLTRQPPQLKGIPARRSVAESDQVRQGFADQIGNEAYDACLAAIEQATPVDHSLYVIADRYLGQAMLDILENSESVEAALSEAQTALENKP
jgi:ABC-type glycerol-3-phosphate transport system substrate-binding protein